MCSTVSCSKKEYDSLVNGPQYSAVVYFFVQNFGIVHSIVYLWLSDVVEHQQAVD